MASVVCWPHIFNFCAKAWPDVCRANVHLCSKLMRVHAAVAGRHTRHGQLLPLEVYLEEGVPLVGGLLGLLGNNWWWWQQVQQGHGRLAVQGGSAWARG